MPKTIAITGPTGSGKTTTAQLLAQKIDKSVNIDADHVKHFIVNGFVYDSSETGIDQWKLLGSNIGMLAKSYLDQNYTVIINGYINEPAWGEITKVIDID